MSQYYFLTVNKMLNKKNAAFKKHFKKWFWPQSFECYSNVYL